jgi:dienelactone hydrolase
MRLALVAAVALLLVPGAAAYKNPTPGRALVLQIPGMHRAKVKRNVVYRQSPRLKMDVYRPRSGKGPLPAVLLGGPPGFGKDSPQKIGWAQLISASGMAAVAFDIRSDRFQVTPAPPSNDVAAAITYVRAHATRLGIDPSRLCTLGFSFGTAPWHLWATMRDPQPWLRCNVVYYGPLDFGDPDLAEYSALTHLLRDGPRIPPMLVVKAGRDENEGINDSIDRFAATARRLHADVRVVTDAGAAHGFDLGRRTPRAKAIVSETLRYLRTRLARPLRFDHDCASAAERAGVVRFFASDDTRLIGIELGSGPRGVVFGHQGGGAPASLCSWVSYGRHLAELGYHVLAIDHRAFGSSGVSPVPANTRSVDLDVLAAVDELRRRGAETIVLGGASLGGSAVLAAAPRIDPPVQGVISFAAPDRFVTVDAIGAVRKSTIPSLFVAAADDDPFAQQAHEFYAASPAADKQVLIVPGFEHGAPVLEEPATAAFVDAWIAAHSK